MLPLKALCAHSGTSSGRVAEEIPEDLRPPNCSSGAPGIPFANARRSETPDGKRREPSPVYLCHPVTPCLICSVFGAVCQRRIGGFFPIFRDNFERKKRDSAKLASLLLYAIANW